MYVGTQHETHLYRVVWGVVVWGGVGWGVVGWGDMGWDSVGWGVTLRLSLLQCSMHRDVFAIMYVRTSWVPLVMVLVVHAERLADYEVLCGSLINT